MLAGRDLSFVLLLLHATTSELIQKFSVRENQPANSFVGKIQKADHQDRAVAAGRQYFFMFPAEADVKTFFTVDETSGEIWTKTELDHEMTSKYVFLAIPVSGGEGIRVQINVLDENDNAPLFPTPSVDVSLSEYAKVGSEVALPSAIDRDSSSLAVQKYVIESGNNGNAFRLSYQLNKEVTFLDLVVNTELDREKCAQYELTIHAYDGGSPPLWGTLLVNVSILDVNDNAPEFEQPRYLIELPSNLTNGDVVATVKATDLDDGENGRVTYYLGPSPGKAETFFTVEERTGVLRWASEEKPQKAYEILINAKDNGEQPLVTSAFILATLVKEVQETVIKITYLTDDATPLIREDMINGSLVARILVFGEGDPSRRLKCSITLVNSEKQPFSIRLIDSIAYLQVSETLDYETQNHYILTVVVANCDDYMGIVMTRNLSINLLDVNDNAPQFVKSVYEAEVKETAPPGTSVVQVEAMDRDECSKGMIRYSLLNVNSSRHSNWFKVDPHSGLITTSEVIECSINPTTNLTVMADDGGGEPGLSGVTTVIIRVTGVNENPPLFKQQFYRASLPEDAEAGFCFLQV